LKKIKRIYKSLKNLVDKGFVRREVRILRRGVISTFLSLLLPKELKGIILERIDNCFRQVMNFIEVSDIA